MSREEAIKKIVWALLAYADTPQKAVAAAKIAKSGLGPRAEGDFRNLLRAAGLFSRDDDGFFVRYILANVQQLLDDGSLHIPVATHLLTVPVPVEPRMRIAYSVFTGLILKFLYQSHGVVPIQVAEGMATLWVPEHRQHLAPLPSDSADQIWKEFQSSDLSKVALQDGIDATFSGLRRGRRIGAIKLPYSWQTTIIKELLQRAVERNLQLFQSQSKKDKLQFTKRPQKPKLTPPPFAFISLTRGSSSKANQLAMESDARCLVCGQQGDLIQGGKFFLPENKKQWYEQPGPRDKFPQICSTCAYISLLSGICPSSDISIAEFPVDNFLELFALHEHLQGVSGAVAIKVMNRVATLSVLPSRYLLLSKTPGKGKMDSKAQVYAQLRSHVPLLKDLDRPMRVQIEGNQPNFWSEIYPHVAIGLSHFARFPRHYDTGERKVLAQRVISVLVEGRPFAALYRSTQAQQLEKGFGWERNVLVRGLGAFETEFVIKYGTQLAQALGGENMNPDFYEDVIGFSNYLLDLVRPLVQREVKIRGSSVSGIARKYTELISRDFVEGRAAKFLYVVCQETDSAERDGDGWAKWQSFKELYGARPEIEGKSGEDAAKAWAEFRNQHPRTLLEKNIDELQKKHGKDPGLWSKFLGEVQARTLALLMLNVRNIQTR